MAKNVKLSSEERTFPVAMQEAKKLRRLLSGLTFGCRTIADVADALNRTERTVRRWIETGRLLATRVRGELMVPNSELERLLQPLRRNAFEPMPMGLSPRAEREWVRSVSSVLAGPTIRRAAERRAA